MNSEEKVRVYRHIFIDLTKSSGHYAWNFMKMQQIYELVEEEPKWRPNAGLEVTYQRFEISCFPNPAQK